MADAPVTRVVTIKFPVTIDPKNYQGDLDRDIPIDIAIQAERELLSEKDEYLLEAVAYALEKHNDDIEVTL